MSPAPRVRAAVPFSFEMYPARTAEAVPGVFDTASALADSGPRFVSVTFGAAGSSRARSIELLRHLRISTLAQPVAHLTCVGADERELRRRIRSFLRLGIRGFVALRGDLPHGDHDESPGCLSASALATLIRDVHADNGDDDALTVAVAAFPNGHPRTRDRRADIDALLAKQDAGADFALTQVLFRSDDYLRYVDEARAAGVGIPIVPGIMPVTTPSRLHRILELTGEETPAELAVGLELGDEHDQRSSGVDFAARLVADVVDGGAHSVHLYAFNRETEALETLRRAGILPSPVITASARPPSHLQEVSL